VLEKGLVLEAEVLFGHLVLVEITRFEVGEVTILADVGIS